MAAKRQKLVADSMSELDRRTNEMLFEMRKIFPQQSADIARLAGGPSIKIETIEESWNIIMKGMQETKSIEEENKRLRDRRHKTVRTTARKLSKSEKILIGFESLYILLIDFIT